MELPYQVDFSNKVAVITGGGGVLMRGFAEALLKCGAKVALLEIDSRAMLKAVAELSEYGDVFGVETDCLSEKSLQEAKELVEARFGACNLLINGAGGNNPKGTTDIETVAQRSEGLKSFFDLSADGIRFVFDLNVLTAFLTTKVFMQGMTEGGNVINVSSMNAFRPLTKIPAYSAAKAAVSNFTQWLAVHFAPAGIRVNAIAPGFFVTNQNYSLLFDKDGNPTARSNKILTHTPMGRFGRPEDLTGALLFLADEKASGFVTGTVLAIDGGFAAYSGV